MKANTYTKREHTKELDQVHNHIVRKMFCLDVVAQIRTSWIDSLLIVDVVVVCRVMYNILFKNRSIVT